MDGFEIRVTAKERKTPREIRIVTENLHDTRFRVPEAWVNFRGVTFERVDFRGQPFEPFHAVSSTFIECDFRKVRFRSGSFGIMTPGAIGSRYLDCRFEGADLRSIRPDNARFERCSFRDAKLRGWQADNAEFVDCVFAGQLYDCRFAGRTWHDQMGLTGRTHNAFTGNDFGDAVLDDVMFIYGIDLDAQRLPDDPRYVRFDRRAERIERARAAVSRWPDDREREAALFELNLRTGPAYEAQDRVFANRYPRGVAQEIANRLWALIEAPLPD